tara:strand:+ start:528 stop:1112 length:585 start_codon:yes stop_codon:yes gene_type:complete
MKQNIIILSAGGHSKSILDVIEATKKFKKIYFLDNKKAGKKIFQYSIFKESKHKELKKKTQNIFIGLGMIKDLKKREFLFQKYKKKGFNFPKIISPYAYVSKRAKIGHGTVIMHGAIVNSGSVIGENCIINSKALIEHDCKIEDNCHISTGSIVNGHSSIGRNSFIGSNSTISNNIKIKKYSFIKLGSVVKKDI